MEPVAVPGASSPRHFAGGAKKEAGVPAPSTTGAMTRACLSCRGARETNEPEKTNYLPSLWDSALSMAASGLSGLYQLRAMTAETKKTWQNPPSRQSCTGDDLSTTRHHVTATPLSGFDVPADLTEFRYPLPRCARTIANGGPLTIVALGSSSTAGAYASSPATSYPARLEIELGLRLPGAAIKVLNRGENGEDVSENLARFEKSVCAERPDLVLWQVGTNWLMQNRPLDEFNSLVLEGLARIQSIGAEAVLIDPQYSPALISKPNLQPLLNCLTTAGRQFRINVCRRFLIMRYWHANLGIQTDIFLSSDELHMND